VADHRERPVSRDTALRISCRVGRGRAFAWIEPDRDVLRLAEAGGACPERAVRRDSERVGSVMSRSPR
jgi:hypothetical protein